MKKPYLYIKGLILLGLALVINPAFAVAEDGNFSDIFEQMGKSFEGTPGLISAAAYLTGIILAVAALLKLKDVIDNPANTSMREVLGRAIIAGALFALPTVMDTVTATIGTQNGDIGTRSFTLEGFGDLGGAAAGAVGANACDMSRALKVFNAASSAGASGDIWGAIGGAIGSYVNGGTLGEAVCYAANSFSSITGLIATALYISGIFLVFWGLLLLRDHLISPDRVPVSMPLKRLLLAGAFFAFPYVATVIRDSIVGDGDALAAIDPFVAASCGSGSTGNLMGALGSLLDLVMGTGGSSGGSSGGGLDCMMVRLVSDLWGPVQMAVSIFCYVAGVILIALALRRMLDNMDKGVRSPVGIGTLSMMAIGGGLLAIDSIVRAVTVSIFPDVFSTAGLATLKLYGSLSYAPGIDENGLDSINTVITTVFAFSFLVGIISIVRGMFILKEVTNGGNASLMAGFTHLLGGGLAVNLGPVVNAVQNTLGLSGVGISVGATPWG